MPLATGLKITTLHLFGLKPIAVYMSLEFPMISTAGVMMLLNKALTSIRIYMLY
jgi:hypothetical protein